MARLPGATSLPPSLQRGESDYFIGAYLLNLVLVEILFALMLRGIIVAHFSEHSTHLTTRPLAPPL